MEGETTSTDIKLERANLLAQLPNPDAGKSKEEQAAIVRVPSLVVTVI